MACMSMCRQNLGIKLCSWCQDVDDYSKDYVERDEQRLADLGRRAVEMYAVSHIFAELQVGPLP